MMGKQIHIAILIFCLTLFVPFIAADDDEIQITISLDRTKIGQEEVATLSVKVISRSQRDLPKPSLPPMTRFDVYSIGTSMQMGQDGSGMKIVNSYNYALSPKKTGKFPIHSAWFVYNGKRYESNTLELEIVGSAREASGPLGELSVDNKGKQKEFFLVPELSKKEVYVDEQVTLKMKVFRQSRRNLLSTPESSKLSAPDFWIQQGVQMTPYRQILNGKEYRVYELVWALYPTKPGKLKIDSYRTTFTVPVKRKSRDPFGTTLGSLFQEVENVTVKSPPITINVKPLPEAGKPKDFGGAVGKYRIFAIVDRSEVEVNESISLKVEITGQGNIKSIPEPELPELEGFRFERSGSNVRQTSTGGTLGGTKTFEFLLLPRVPGDLTIEPLSLSYFDPEKKKYFTSKTKPISLKVKQGEIAAGTEIPYNPINGQTINLQETDIRHIKTSNSGLMPIGTMTLSSPVFLAFVGVPILALIGGFVDVRRRNKLAGDVAYARLKNAKSVAQKRLKKTEEFLNNNDDGFYAELSGVIYQFIADKLNQSAQGLTIDMVIDMLTEKGATETLIGEIKEVIQEADFGRFAGTGTGNEDRRKLYDRAASIISELEETL